MHQPPYPPAPGYGAPTPQKSGASIVVIIIVSILAILVVGGGILAVLAIYGTRKYISNAKSAEARFTLGMIGKDAQSAYENESLDPNLTLGGTPSIKHTVCPSGKPIPSDVSSISGKKYQSSMSEWQDKAGWECLRFEMSQPQYYQYRFDGQGTGFKATAQGDLNGDGVFSKFELSGKVQSDRLVIAPALVETNPDE